MTDIDIIPSLALRRTNPGVSSRSLTGKRAQEHCQRTPCCFLGGAAQGSSRRGPCAVVSSALGLVSSLMRIRYRYAIVHRTCIVGSTW